MDNERSEERTFREYTKVQAEAYASHRVPYHQRLYEVVVDHHRATGGSFGTVVDVGCGPGNSMRPLAKYFDHAYGIDPSPEMINTAVKIGAEAVGGETANGSRIDFVVGRAEELRYLRDSGIKVDLLIAAMAAHWFDMPQFWASAARIINDGGTVALWTAASCFCHPSTPNAAHIQQTLFRLERKHLAPFELRGNRLARDGYDDLPLPWDCDPPIEGFSKAAYKKLDWARGDQLSEPDHFFLGDEHVILSQLQGQLSTASMVTRWREAYPQLAGTKEDVVDVMIRDLRETLGREDLIVGRSCHLLLFKKGL